MKHWTVTALSAFLTLHSCITATTHTAKPRNAVGADASRYSSVDTSSHLAAWRTTELRNATRSATRLSLLRWQHCSLAWEDWKRKTGANFMFSFCKTCCTAVIFFPFFRLEAPSKFLKNHMPPQLSVTFCILVKQFVHHIKYLAINAFSCCKKKSQWNTEHGDKKSIRRTSFPRIKYGAKKLNSHECNFLIIKYLSLNVTCSWILRYRNINEKWKTKLCIPIK